MSTVPPPQNQFLAILWFTLGVAVVVAAIAALFGKGAFIAPALLMMSGVLFMLSAQRTKRFAIEQAKFNKRMQFIGFSVAILSSLSIVLNQAVF